MLEICGLYWVGNKLELLSELSSWLGSLPNFRILPRRLTHFILYVYRVTLDMHAYYDTTWQCMRRGLCTLVPSLENKIVLVCKLQVEIYSVHWVSI